MSRIATIVLAALLVVGAALAARAAWRGAHSPEGGSAADTIATVSDSGAVIGAAAGPPRHPGLLLDTARVDLTGDGAAERLELYAEVERDARGRIMWDDGQRWMLLVRREEQTYAVFDRFVQLGRVRFWALEHATDGRSLLVLVETGSGLVAELHAFDAAVNGFRQVDRLQASGNVVHVTSPELF